jgi:SAM-dependent methyltransferase
MALVTPALPDALRPSASAALDAWSARVRADREQVHRLREIEDPADFYGPVADRFRVDPHRRDDAVLAALLGLARPDETWLDIGAGGGRYALPLALVVREVVAVEPSPGMLAVLRAAMTDAGIGNVRVVEDRWPPAEAPGHGSVRPNVALMAHVGYDIEDIGAFLDAAEAAVSRLCVAVVGEEAMTTVATLFWRPIYGEPRVLLPALPELLAVLIARGRLPEVRLVDRVPPAFESTDELLAMARRQLWVRLGSERDDRLVRLVAEQASERDGRWALDWTASRIGVVSWEPRDRD